MIPLLLMLVLVPAPKETEEWPIGEWECQWGGGKQQMIFYRDGTYHSREYGAGRWSLGDDGTVYFSERDDTISYALWVNRAGDGNGCRICRETWLPGGNVAVRITRVR